MMAMGITDGFGSGASFNEDARSGLGDAVPLEGAVNGVEDPLTGVEDPLEEAGV